MKKKPSANITSQSAASDSITPSNSDVNIAANLFYSRGICKVCRVAMKKIGQIEEGTL